MAAPDYVPTSTDEQPRVYSSPPRRPDPWLADRPAELAGLQPLGPQLGAPGPDQGYALKLAREFEGRLVLTPGEAHEDAVSGCMAIATRRSGMFGRAPVIHDLTLAFTLWGFLGEGPQELVAIRKERFAAVASPHHYAERRAIADGVPEELLRMTPAAVSHLLRNEPEQVMAYARGLEAAQRSDLPD